MQDGKPGNEQGVPLESIFDALSHSRRLHLVEYMSDKEKASLKDVANYIIEQEGVENPSRIAASLHHQHLPRLDSIGIVEWDAGKEMIHRGVEFDKAYSYTEKR